MSRALTDWYPGTVPPAQKGYYIVNHPRGTWNTGEKVLARFDGTKWERPLGWPAPKVGHGFCSLCAMEKGRVFDPGCNVFKEVEPTEWRGLRHA